jgi:hypothetical protein
MSEIIRPGAGILLMKVGTHAQEPLEEIIARKTKEIEDAGYALWGYGGNTCHPQTMVQPFAKAFEQRGKTIYLCMQEMDSKHFAEKVRADQCSVDGITWKDIPAPINVLGSRYALAIKSLRKEEFDLPLAQAQVAIGPSQGRTGDKYISGRVDKACFEIVAPAAKTVVPAVEAIAPAAVKAVESNSTMKINLVAELIAPYAVYLRNK